jgi:hypothetical protein
MRDERMFGYYVHGVSVDKNLHAVRKPRFVNHLYLTSICSWHTSFLTQLLCESHEKKIIFLQ